MTEAQLLGIDVGGSVVKAAVFAATGELLATVGADSEPITASGGVAERDPKVLWKAAAAVVRACLNAPEVRPDRLVAVGVTGYGNGLLLVDRDGRPTRNAVASVDTRAAGIVQEWRDAGHEAAMLDRTFQPFWAGQPLPLLEWVRRFEPWALDDADALLQSKDYVRLRLTGSLRFERSDLGSAGLWDPAGRTVPHELLADLGLGRAAELLRPGEILEPTDIAGQVTRAAAAETGLPVGLPVVAGTLDGLACTIGSGITEAGHLSITSGTWGINQVLATAPDATRTVFQSLAALDPASYLLVEASPNSMSNFAWFVRHFRLTADRPLTGRDYEELDRVAAATRLDERDPLLFLPHVYATPRHPMRNGMLIGLTGAADADRVLRAVYEGIVFEHRILIDRLGGVDRAVPPMLGGGVTRSATWPQLFADALGTPITTPDTVELGSRGVSMLAGVAAGLYDDVGSAAAAMTSVGARLTPDPDRADTLQARFERFREVRERTLQLHQC